MGHTELVIDGGLTGQRLVLMRFEDGSVFVEAFDLNAFGQTRSADVAISEEQAAELAAFLTDTK